MGNFYLLPLLPVSAQTAAVFRCMHIYRDQIYMYKLKSFTGLISTFSVIQQHPPSSPHLLMAYPAPAAAKDMERSKVQRLYDACETVFCTGRHGLPTLAHIRWLQTLLDDMEPADVGIDGSADETMDGSGSDASGDERWQAEEPCNLVIKDGLILAPALKQITYIHIHECEDFSMGLFCFPAGATMPLHDHPRMVVLTKVLYGSVSCNAYDWVNVSNSSPRKNGLAKVVAEERVLQASSRASVLFPRSGGNIHSFTALTPCAILDVLSPPYSDELERPSTYYIDMPIPPLPGFCILEETQVPEDLVVAGAPYLGPELFVEDDDDDDIMY